MCDNFTLHCALYDKRAPKWEALISEIESGKYVISKWNFGSNPNGELPKLY
jgi:hypothetical protein